MKKDFAKLDVEHRERKQVDHVLPSERIERSSARRRTLNLTLLIVFPLVGALGGWWVASHRVEMYQATALARLELNPLRGRARLKKRVFGDQLAVMFSVSGLKTIADALSVEERTKLLQQAAGGSVSRKRRRADPDAQLVTLLRANLYAERMEQTDLLSISFSNQDAGLAADVVNTAVRAMALVNLDHAERRVDRNETALRSRVKELEDEVQASRLHEHALTQGLLLTGVQAPAASSGALATQAFDRRRARKGLVNNTPSATNGEQPADFYLDAEYDSQAQILRSLARESHRADRESQLSVLQARMQAEDSQRNRQVFDDGASDLSRAITAAMSRYDALVATLGQSHPEVETERAEVERLRAEIVELRKREQQLADARALMAKGVAEQLRAGTKEEQKRLTEIIDRQRKNNFLYRSIAIDQEILQGVEDLLKSARIETPMNEAVFVEVSPAVPPDQPIPRGILRTAARYGGLSFLLALCVSYLSLLRSLSFWTIEELRATAGAPVFSVSSWCRDGLRAGVQGRRRTEEDVSALRDSVMMSPRGKRGVLVLFTSSLPREGKTTMLATFAASLARAGRSALVIDANLHRPAVHKAFGLDARQGLSNVLEGRLALSEAIQEVSGVPGLGVLTSGPVPPDPVTLLVSSNLRQVLEAASERYEFVLLDAPPTGEFADAQYLVSFCQILLFVAQYGRVQRHFAAKLLKRFASTQLRLRGLLVTGAPGARE